MTYLGLLYSHQSPWAVNFSQKVELGGISPCDRQSTGPVLGPDPVLNFLLSIVFLLSAERGKGTI